MLARLLHEKFVFGGRIRRLAEGLLTVLPERGTVLDVGCGDGQLASLIMKARPGLEISGIEIAARPDCRIPCRAFDGTTIPYDDGAFDACMFVDVLHHTHAAGALLSEAVRVARNGVVIKDHLCENSFDHAVLTFMDWVGNRPYGVVLPYNFLARRQWDDLFDAAGVSVASWNDRVPIYPFPASALFGRGLHFIGRLERETHP